MGFQNGRIGSDIGGLTRTESGVCVMASESACNTEIGIGIGRKKRKSKSPAQVTVSTLLCDLTAEPIIMSATKSSDRFCSTLYLQGKFF